MAKRGFTLTEVLVVLGILAIIGTFGLVVSFESFRQYSFKNDRNLIVAALEKARNQAVNNVCLSSVLSPCTGGKKHGVRFGTGAVTLFQGDTYSALDTTNETVQLTSATTVVGGSPSNTQEVVFAPLSGDASVMPVGAWSVTVHNDSTGQSSVISFNSEGMISWTN